MLCLSAPKSPLYTLLCMSGAGALPTMFLHCQLASRYVIQKRKRSGKTFFPFACNSHGLFPQWLQLGPVFSYYWHHKRRSWYFTGISIRQAVTPPQKSKTPLFSTHHLSFYVLILLTTSLYFPSLRDSTCFLGYLHLSFFLI